MEKILLLKKMGFAEKGFKINDIDQIIEYLGKLNYIDYNKALNINLKRQNIWAKNRLGLVINITGRNSFLTLKVNNYLRELGYDTMMIFVDVDKTLAHQRIQQRYKNQLSTTGRGRDVDNSYFNLTSNELEKNKIVFKNAFGKNFIEIFNGNDLTAFYKPLLKKVNEFLN